MMPALQYLRHGKALCGKVFNRFVETFNFHNDFIANLKGDGDLPGSNGCMNVDTTDPKHPVIRLNKNKLDLQEHGGEDRDAIPGLYEIVSIEGGVVTMKNPYFSVGGKTYEGSSTEATLTGGETGVIALRISATGGSAPADSLEVYDSVASLQAAQQSLDYYTIPLFMISTTVDEETGEETYDVVCDFRIGPDAAMGEFA